MFRESPAPSRADAAPSSLDTLLMELLSEMSISDLLPGHFPGRGPPIQKSDLIADVAASLCLKPALIGDEKALLRAFLKQYLSDKWLIPSPIQPLPVVGSSPLPSDDEARTPDDDSLPLQLYPTDVKLGLEDSVRNLRPPFLGIADTVAASASCRAARGICSETAKKQKDLFSDSDGEDDLYDFWSAAASRSHGEEDRDLRDAALSSDPAPRMSSSAAWSHH